MLFFVIKYLWIFTDIFIDTIQFLKTSILNFLNDSRGHQYASSQNKMTVNKVNHISNHTLFNYLLFKLIFINYILTAIKTIKKSCKINLQDLEFI